MLGAESALRTESNAVIQMRNNHNLAYTAPSGSLIMNSFCARYNKQFCKYLSRLSLCCIIPSHTAKIERGKCVHIPQWFLLTLPFWRFILFEPHWWTLLLISMSALCSVHFIPRLIFTTNIDRADVTCFGQSCWISTVAGTRVSSESSPKRCLKIMRNLLRSLSTLSGPKAENTAFWAKSFRVSCHTVLRNDEATEHTRHYSVFFFYRNWR